MPNEASKTISWSATLGGLLLLAMPILGALFHPTGQYLHHHGPILPVPETFGWLLVAIGLVLYLMLRRYNLHMAACPPSPSRLAQSSEWVLLASGSRHTSGDRDRLRVRF